MPHATTDDGVRLYYEETGSGRPVIFVHEYAGDYRSWEPQMRHFGQRYRAITYNARGYPPSDVPEDVAKYSQARAADDISSVLDHLKIDKAHVVGLSMGGFATLHYGFRHPTRALSLCVAGCGYGAERGQTERFRTEAETIAGFIAEQGMEVFAGKYAYGPTRVQFENKDPRGFAEFRQMLAEHSAVGARNTQLGVQRERPGLRLPAGFQRHLPFGFLPQIPLPSQHRARPHRLRSVLRHAEHQRPEISYTGRHFQALPSPHAG